MNSTRAQRDRAFSETVDPAAYVPREATEGSLTGLQGWFQGDGEEARQTPIAALIAPPGLGKTFILRLIESRLNARSSERHDLPRALYIPYAGLLPLDLCEWVHGLLGRSMPLSDATDASLAAVSALVGLAHSADRPFLLLMDDADSMPNETVRAFLEALPRKGSPLRILMALGQDARSSRLLAAFDSLGIFEVRLETPMTEDETSAYVRARMRWAGLAEQEIDSLDAHAIRRIHGLSGGVPRRVHRVAASLFEPTEDRLPSDLDTKLRREDWMGRPIEDDL